MKTQSSSQNEWVLSVLMTMDTRAETILEELATIARKAGEAIKKCATIGKQVGLERIQVESSHKTNPLQSRSNSKVPLRPAPTSIWVGWWRDPTPNSAGARRKRTQQEDNIPV